jgi:CRISPR-associated protein (TIGR03986 family)
MDKDYRFLNPYNFVRYLSKGTENSAPEIKLLGRCAPPPHDRFIGLTGKIECKLESFTLIFIPDSEFVESEKEHKSYRFYTLKNENGEEEPAIPSTSLRGMLRSVFEAATNSCFSVFDGGFLGKRETPKKYRGIQAGRIIKIPENEEQPGIVRIMKYYKLPHKKFRQYKDSINKNGQKVFVKIEKGKIECIREGDTNTTENYAKGYLKTSDEGLPGEKKNEYVFVEDEKSKNLTLSYETYQNYKSANRNNRHENTKIPKENDTIWLISDGTNVTEFGYAQIYRKLFKKSIDDLLPQEMHHCKDYDSLCPACRLFGWVNSDCVQEGAQKIAYAGRIRISHGRIIGNREVLGEFPLAILSSPKPTATFFYLLDEKGESKFNVAYANDARLRGRKFFRHQRMAEEKEYKRADNKTDNQNRSLKNVLGPGAKFDFTICFENLSPIELGALLWAIEMEEGMYHKIGLAKPLGFGSVKLSIENISILDVRRRYSSFSNCGWKTMEKHKKNKFLDLFRGTMENKYGKPFKELDNIKDLTAILSEPSSNLPVHYPRTSETPDADGKNFEWFEKNKEYGKKALDIAHEDTDGLPLHFGQDGK